MNDREIVRYATLVVDTYRLVARKYIDAGVATAHEALADMLRKDPSLRDCDMFLSAFPLVFLAEKLHRQ